MKSQSITTVSDENKADDYAPRCTILTPCTLFRYFFSWKSMILLASTFITIFLMNVCNAFAYRRMPTDAPLPDVVADSWKQFGYLRNSKSYMKHQPADLLSITLTVICSVLGIFKWNTINVPKLAMVYICSLYLRMLFFSVTGLPPPCIGYPNCPCAVKPWSSIAANHSIPKIAFVYTFAIGLFVGEIPQCGDLTMSGHTIYLWVLGLFIIDSLTKFMSPKALVLAKIPLICVLLFVSCTIVFIRNHYAIDVVLAIVYVNMLWKLYSLGQVFLSISQEPFSSSRIGKILKWLEKDMDAKNEDSLFDVDSA